MLEGQLYQLGFVCDNLEEAIDSFRDRGMTHEPHIMEVDQPVNTPNGEVVNKGTGASVTKGRIVLQSEGAEIEFRKVELVPLGK